MPFIWNNFNLDRIISHSIIFPLTNTCDHKLTSFKIESQNVTNAKKDSYDFKMADFKSINNYLSKNNWTSLFDKSKNLQHFDDQFISLIQTSIKRFVPLYS